MEKYPSAQSRLRCSDCGAAENDCEDLADLPVKAEGCVVSMTIRETRPGEQDIAALQAGRERLEICAVYGGEADGRRLHA